MNQTRLITADPTGLDVISTGNEYALSFQGEILTTSGGHPVRHKNIRLMQQVLTGIITGQETDPWSVCALFLTETDLMQGDVSHVHQSLRDAFGRDLLLKTARKASETQSSEPFLPAASLLEHPEWIHLLLFAGTALRDAFGQYLAGLSLQNPEAGGPEDEDSRFMNAVLDDLSASEEACLYRMINEADCSPGLSLLLIREAVTPSEFGLGMLQHQLQMHMNKGEPGNTSLPPFHETLEHYSRIASKVSDYLRFDHMYSNAERHLLDLIASGEGERLEFKSTLRWNLRESKKDPNVEHACLKTVCAFLNTAGGILLIGVTDDGRVTGIEDDRFENNDKFYIHLWNLIRSQIGEEFTPYIQSSLVKINAATICKVQCLPAPRPVFLQQKGSEDEFFIRTGAATTRLGVGDAYRYINEQWKR